MTVPNINPLLERQLLLQLGDRLRALRKAQGLGTVDLSARAGLTRNTLRSIESGDPSPSIGAYLRVMSVLGVSGELALLAGDTLQPPPVNSAAARSQRLAPAVEVHVLAENTSHRVQDLQSLALHEESIRLVKANPELLEQAQATLERWINKGDSRSISLWLEWRSVLRAGSWRKVLGHTRHAQQLRQSSPLVTILPDDARQNILKQVRTLKKGLIFSGSLHESPEDIGNAKGQS